MTDEEAIALWRTLAAFEMCLAQFPPETPLSPTAPWCTLPRDGHTEHVASDGVAVLARWTKAATEGAWR